MLTVFGLTIRQLTGIRRQAVLWVFSASPLAVAILIRSLSDDYSEITLGMINLLMVAVVLPLVVAILATTALGDDVEDRTLSFIVLRPVPRWQIVASKYVAVIILGAIPVLLFGAAMAAVGLVQEVGDIGKYEESIKPILGVLAGLAIGLLAYSALFMWLGLVSGQALGLAIVYVFVWEGVAAGIFDGIRYLSIRSYSIMTMEAVGGPRLEDVSPISAGDGSLLGVGLGGAAVVTAVFLTVTLNQLRNMDVP